MKKLILAACLVAGSAAAETADYGRISLGGLARDTSWPYNAAGVSFAMVCNVNGPDGFLTIRTGPGSDYASARKFNRLVVVEVDTRQRQGNWVRVLGGYRNHDKNGKPQEYKNLPVTGWAHDGYLCSFLD
jgi:hypothetical protein